MKFIVIILFIVSLNSCAGLTSTSLINSFLTPTTAITTVADYGIEQETGKKISEHALSLATSQDCKFNLSEMSICKDASLVAGKKSSVLPD
jgi:hypothetical protein